MVYEKQKQLREEIDLKDEIIISLRNENKYLIKRNSELLDKIDEREHIYRED